MYNSDVTQISDSINEFKVVASGTVSTAVGVQYPTLNISKPTRLYRNYVLFVQNKTGQSMASVTPYAKNTGLLLPNVPNTGVVIFPVIGGTAPTNTQYSYVGIPNSIFALGDAQIQFNLSALTTATGTIDYVLIGY
jgi:hypothetical protein